ncbi:uncharacterized protein PITG_16007 [Phytophthora infestans T30-4]|uniref:Uncharacterized protein n=1 Tax=Phytophthora infestans (strain T30-4) TaxID=403677 RepID=D0NSM8_PHYIT|nr:uncharacterized protein PITG_16007 [Phytophthora infestans T30-4]EEY64590.1 hypothetical protein PITG_16007 [Phytophthora infestans T30-4]|eukprot:XP_002897790.1 hypothetical protein PITG_16007 [Phytophthora infestans T30-4]
MAQYVRDFAVQYGGDDPRHAVLWGKTTCQSRWTSQFKRYTTRERKSSSTGLGITEEMLVNGVTISAMIEKACPFYEPIDALFAEQANVNPESQCHVPDLSDDEEAMEFKTKELEVYVHEQRRSREERDQEREDKHREKWDDDRRKMVVELFRGGKPIAECTFDSLTFLLRCRAYIRGAPDVIIIFFVKRVVVPFVFQRNTEVMKQDAG